MFCHTSLLEEDRVAFAEKVITRCMHWTVELVLPQDVVVASEFSADAPSNVVDALEIPDGWRIMDIGPAATKFFIAELEECKTVLWNGPMGVFEMEPFAKGTVALAEVIAASDGTSGVGGGDSVAAVHQAGVADRITHISTGGGASLEFLAGENLPGVEVLTDA